MENIIGLYGNACTSIELVRYTFCDCARTQHGKHITRWINRCCLFARTPSGGDIVVTNYNNPFRERLIKRVVATEGQEIFIKNGTVIIDGTVLDEPYIKNKNWSGESAAIIVPPDSVYLLGDNRTFSRDSREIGCISCADLIGTVSYK